MKEYPEEATVVFFYNLTVAIIAAFVGLILEKDPSAWILRQNTALASILCSVRTNKKLLNKCHCPLIVYHLTKTFFSFLYFTGTFWIMFKQYSSYMGPPIERAGVRSNVQAVVDCCCYSNGCSVSW